MNSSNDIDDYIERLKSRYPRDNATLDLLHLIEMLRDENRALRGIIPKPAPNNGIRINAND